MAIALNLDAVPELISLWEQCGLTRPWNDPVADARMAIEGPSSAILGVREGGALLGAVMVGFDGHRGWVYYLAVTPGRRRAGLGRRLMAAAEAWLGEQRCPAIRLMVRDDNVEAIGFYEAIGYQVQKVATIGKRLDEGQ